MSKVIYIQSASSHIGSYQNLYVSDAELLHDRIALHLRQLTVQRIGVVTLLHQFIGNLLCFFTCAAENDTVYLRVIVNDAFKRSIFVFGMYGIHHMLYVVVTFVLASDGYFLGIAKIVFGYSCNFGRHGSREQQRVSFFRNIGQNGVDAIGETHIQHLVSFIHNHIANGGKRYRFAFHEVQQTSRSGYNNVHALL